ncbi:hypothetical protein OROGR_019044 [Orobanche gracilis]
MLGHLSFTQQFTKMWTTTMKALSLLLFTFYIALASLALPTQSCGASTTKYNVTIVNLAYYIDYEVHPVITIHCSSKDKDIGSHELRGDSFSWDVCVPKFGGKPVFVCDFSIGDYLGYRQAKITVFNQDISKDCQNNVCTWIAWQDQIYLETSGATSPWSYSWG